MVLSGVATLTEIEREYSLGDVVKMNEALDLKIAIEREASEQSRRGSK